MNPSFRFDADGVSDLQVLWEDGERVLCRGWRADGDGGRSAALAVLLAAERPPPAALDRLAHEYELRDALDAEWAARPLALSREGGRTALLLEDPGGEPLERLIGAPMDTGCFLRLAIGIAAALGKAHLHGLVHKDVKPANILVNCPDGRARLTGFGIASRLPRERQAPEPPGVIAGTLAYMAPEQTGRMNRSIDSRSDLYALGVIFYQMLTGRLPFSAADPMEWVHCHIARKPAAPAQRLESVPAPISEIVMKLLAKTAEDRYQIAAGVEHDLRRCLAEWERHARVEPFALGERDRPDRLMIPGKLYGREGEVASLLAAFDRVVESGAPELILVSGYSGIGKSSVVNELHKALVPLRGIFASGKFDQLKRDIPYSTLVQAFESLVRSLLSKSDAELAQWRHALLEALGPSGRLMTDLIPELKLIVGDQPPVPDLERRQARVRFQLVFRHFIGVFARPEHPLVLFLDDLQWLDAATLDLLEDLLTRSDLQHLMLIGAYRDNEVTATHPLMCKLDAIRTAGGKVAEIRLAPLEPEHLGQLIADTLRCAAGRAAPLAQLVHEKTAGNPFFAIQFISALAEEGLLRFDHDAGCWSWVLERIHAKGYSDNVVDLMVGKLARLPPETREALQQFACLGNTADITTVSLVLGTSEEEAHALLWEAARQELIHRLVGAYQFAHDRIHEAAYSLMPHASRPEAHLRIGRQLAIHTPPEQLEEVIFEIVNQLNRGAALITSPDERERLAQLNLIAGRRAKASTAYFSASRYLAAAMADLGEQGWRDCYELAFSVCIELAECEVLNSNFGEAAQWIEELLLRARSKVERAQTYRLRMVLQLVHGDNAPAIQTAVECLQMFGIQLPERPTNDQVTAEYDAMWSNLGAHPIGSLLDLPMMEDPNMREVMNVFTILSLSAYFTDSNLCQTIACRMVRVTLEHGTTVSAGTSYGFLSIFLGPFFQRYKVGEEFAQLAVAMAEKHGFREQKAAASFLKQMAVLWTQPIEVALTCLDDAIASAQETGEIIWACYSLEHRLTDRLARGDHLDQVWSESGKALEFVERFKFRHVADILCSTRLFVQSLRGQADRAAVVAEAALEARLLEDGIAVVICFHWILQIQRHLLLGDPETALEYAEKAKPLLWSARCHIQFANYRLYEAFALAAAYGAASPEKQAEIRSELSANAQALERWAESSPVTFSHKHLLVCGELARVEGRPMEAMQLYERAARTAAEHGFVQDQALANELAGQCCLASGLERAAHAYLLEARHCYVRWGANGKVGQLDQLYPHLRKQEGAPSPMSTIGAPVEHLDLATVIKVSQAVSGEIVLENLIDTLMHTAMGQAGAERALLIMPCGQEPRIEAEATTSGDTVTVRLVDEAVAERVLPVSVLQYVLRTREIVILDDAAAQSPYRLDSYIRQRQARSILCLPLLNQAKLIGMLYLENNLAPRAFAPARIAVLKLLASQAAIALENAHLYRDVGERETKIRRLVDSNIIGIFIWDFDGRVLEANDEFLRMVQYDREALASGRIRWADLTPPDWRDRNNARIERQKSSGRFEPFEKEYTRKDGSRVPVLIGGATFDKGGNQGVAFVLDLTERKRAEEAARLNAEALRRSEAYLAEAQSLSHTGSSAYNETAILYWSDENYRIFGFDPREGLPSHKAALERIHPDDRERVREEARRAVEQNKDYKLKYRILLPEGTIKYIETDAHPKISASGELVEVVSTIIDVTERRRAEQELRESEYKLRQIIETVPGLIWSNGPDGEPTHVNQRMLDFSGMRFEDFRLRGWEAFVHPADFPGTAEAFHHAIQAGISYEGVMRLRRADGEFRWHHARCEPLRDRQGRIIQWYSLSVDIEERKQAEDRLRRSEAYLAEAQRLTHVGVAAYNETAILYGSEETYRMWGFDSAQGVPSRDAVFRRIHPDDFDRMQAEIQRALGQKRRYSIEYRILLPDGTVKHLESIGAPEFSERGELVEIVATQIDVTERKHAEQALRESEAKFRDYAETASDWFWEIGPDYKLTLLTGNASGRGPASRIGTTWKDRALDLETEPEKWRVFQATLDARRPFRDFIYRSARGDGTPIYVKASGKPVFDVNGEFCGYRGTGTDVTATMRAQEEHERLRQLEADLAHLNRMSIMGELAATLAHEVKQPVATARNNARAAMHFLDRTPPDLGEVREALACVVDDAHRAGEIIDRIRDQIKKMPPRNDRFDANVAVAEVIEMAQSAITKGGVSMRTRLGEGPLCVQGDCVQLQQVVLNLILNAVEAMSSVEPGARELSISTEQGQAGGVVVAVRDSGPGIDPDGFERVFEPFYTTKSSGVGMGLAICRSIVDAHGGRLWADANKPRGAVFQFTLPRADDEITNPLREAHPAGEPHAGSISDISRQRTSEDNTRRHPAKRARAPRRSDRPSKGSSGSRTPPR